MEKLQAALDAALTKLHDAIVAEEHALAETYGRIIASLASLINGA